MINNAALSKVIADLEAVACGIKDQLAAVERMLPADMVTPVGIQMIAIDCSLCSTVSSHHCSTIVPVL